MIIIDSFIQCTHCTEIIYPNILNQLKANTMLQLEWHTHRYMSGSKLRLAECLNLLSVKLSNYSNKNQTVGITYNTTLSRVTLDNYKN